MKRQLFAANLQYILALPNRCTYITIRSDYIINVNSRIDVYGKKYKKLTNRFKC